MKQQISTPLFRTRPLYKAVRQPSQEFGFAVGLADTKRQIQVAFTATQAANLLAVLRAKTRYGRSSAGDMQVDALPALDGAFDWRVGLFGATVVFVLNTQERDNLIDVLASVVEAK